MVPAPQRRPSQPSPAFAASMAGAVDLAAVKARSEAAARAAEAPAPTAGQYVIDVTEESFQGEVLDRSFQVPVLLDLWAEWCQPCKQLSPVLERLATEAAGAWILAKIDVDANPRISQALQVQSIPTVFAVIGGQLVPGFQGVLPEAQLREFVAAVLQAAQQAGMSVPTAGADGAGQQGDGGEPAPAAAQEQAAQSQLPEDPRFDAAEEALAEGNYVLAEQRFQAILDAEPTNAEAQLALRQVRLLGRVVAIDPGVRAQADAAPGDVDLRLAAADLELAGDEVDAALHRLLAGLAASTGDEREQLRLRLVDYFELLGPQDPRVAPARREMARALF